MSKVKNIIKQLGLTPHLEGGYYKRTYQSSHETCFNGITRPISTAIYYLLENQDFSCWHRLTSDEVWHHYAGSNLLMHQINPDGELSTIILGNILDNRDAKPQHTIPANTWFAAQVATESSFALIGCTVAPGFDFADFEMGEQGALLEAYPKHADLIRLLTRKNKQ